MPLDTYANLQKAIATWAYRPRDAEFLAATPDFIRLLETRINRELRTTFQEATTPIVVTMGVGDLPDDYLAFRSISTAGAYPRVLASSADAFWGDQFAVDGRTIRIGGLTAPGNLTIDYYARIPSLSDDRPTNWLLDKAPDIYLYGSLLEASLFMQDENPASLSNWTAAYQKAVSDLQTLDTMARYSRASVRVSGPTP